MSAIRSAEILSHEAAETAAGLLVAKMQDAERVFAGVPSLEE